mmetsp:Transcript_6196/g.5320  ORF Transcript_6196/g.5320 Transcript_6196/m.5320 type:complete len:84 (+) Transcript_6196:193-444(+)
MNSISMKSIMRLPNADTLIPTSKGGLRDSTDKIFGKNDMQPFMINATKDHNNNSKDKGLDYNFNDVLKSIDKQQNSKKIMGNR